MHWCHLTPDIFHFYLSDIVSVRLLAVLIADDWCDETVSEQYLRLIAHSSDLCIRSMTTAILVSLNQVGCEYDLERLRRVVLESLSHVHRPRAWQGPCGAHMFGRIHLRRTVFTGLYKPSLQLRTPPASFDNRKCQYTEEPTRSSTVRAGRLWR